MIQIQHPVANALAAQQLVRTIGIGEEVVLLRRFVSDDLRQRVETTIHNSNNNINICKVDINVMVVLLVVDGGLIYSVYNIYIYVNYQTFVLLWVNDDTCKQMNVLLYG